MKDKFNISVDLNQTLAKRYVVDMIWKSANLEGIAVTFPQTQDVFDGLSTTLKVNDIIVINNLKHSWMFLLETLYYDCDYAYICKINQLVGEGLYARARFLRSVPVTMGGTTWVPEFPIESVIKEKLEEILKIECVTERAIYLMLYCMRAQLFLDGNKRTAMLVANQILISHGKGYIDVDIELQNKFRELLIHFYETNGYDDIVTFIYDKCLKGVIEKIDKKADEEHLKMLDVFNFIKK